MQNLLFLDQAKAHLSITDNALDNDITRWIESASAAIESWCDQPVGQETAIDDLGNVRFQFAGSGRSTKVHGYHPATAVKLEYQSEVGGEWTEIDEDQYESIEDDGVPMLRYTEAFARGTMYRATLMVGFVVGTSSDDTEIPTRIQSCVLDLVTQAWKQSEQGAKRFGIKQEAISDGNSLGSHTTIFSDVSIEWQRQLAPYKRRGL